MNILQFDTREKKPNLYHLLLPAAAAGAAVLFLSLGGTERRAVPICLVMSAFCLTALVSLLPRPMLKAHRSHGSHRWCSAGTSEHILQTRRAGIERMPALLL